MENRKYRFVYFGAFFLVLVIMSAVTCLLTGKIPLWGGKPWLGLVIGGGALLVSIPFHLIGKKNKALYLVSFLINTFSGGLFAATFFTFAKQKTGFADLLLPSAIVLAAMLFCCFLAGSSKYGRDALIVAIFLNLAAELAVAILWMVYRGIFYPYLFFLLVPLLMLWIGMKKDKSEDAIPLRYISFASYGYSLLIGLIVLIIVSEGDILEGLDAIDLGGGIRKKPKDMV